MQSVGIERGQARRVILNRSMMLVAGGDIRGAQQLDFYSVDERMTPCLAEITFTAAGASCVFDGRMTHVVALRWREGKL